MWCVRAALVLLYITLYIALATAFTVCPDIDLRLGDLPSTPFVSSCPARKKLHIYSILIGKCNLEAFRLA